MIRIIVLADTHIRRGSTRRLPDSAYDLLLGADLIWHAGDVLIPEFLHELEGFAPVRAVLGNNDAELVGILPEQCEETIDGIRLAMIHDSGPAMGRGERMRQLFPEADVVIFGHSHLPCTEQSAAGVHLFNPGSPTERRQAPSHTLGVIEITSGAFSASVVAL
jgi:putative phosphoesterase